MMRDRTHRPLLLPLLAAAALLAAARGASCTDLPLVKDAHISATKATKKLGARPSLSLSATDTVLLEFDLAALPEETTPSMVTRANLWLWVADVKEPGSFSVRRVAAEWEELTVSGLVAPATHAPDPPLDVAVDADDEGGYLLVDVTGFVREWVGEGHPNHGLALLGEDAIALTIDARENPRPGRTPRLDVTLGTSGVLGTLLLGGSDEADYFAESPSFVSGLVTIEVEADDRLVVDASGSFVTDKVGGEQVIVIIGYRKSGTGPITYSGNGAVVSVPTYSEQDYQESFVSLGTAVGSLEPGTYEFGIAGYKLAPLGPFTEAYSVRTSVRIQSFD